jgi:16S rRNA (cytosine1402-N4)-methyltransferase
MMVAGNIAMDDKACHIPVLLSEVMNALSVKPGDVIVDGTFGAGGYTKALLEAGARVFAFDRDPDAIRNGQTLAKEWGDKLTLIEAPFSDMKHALAVLGVSRVDGVVLDIGVSSMQLDQAERGFSFRHDGPLDMRMAQSGTSAADLVNTLKPDVLANLLYVYGEERRSRHIARAVAKAREARPIETTGELAKIVSDAISRPNDIIHPATRTFQALRIAVNHELDELAGALQAAEELLAEGGRLAVVTFHSLEDRIVKRFLQSRSSKASGASRHVPIVHLPEPTFDLVFRKAVTASDDEVASNPRARSAKLRAGVRTAVVPRQEDVSIVHELLSVPVDPRVAKQKGFRR